MLDVSPPRSTIPTVQRAPYFVGGGRIEWRERPVVMPGPGQLLVRVRANAVCGTDRQQLAAGSSVTPGHEAAGEVAAAGPGTSADVGTRGVVYLMDFCGACRGCREGATNRCSAKRADMGFTADGGYGAYELVHESNFFPTDPELSHAEATLLLDVMGTSRHALDRARLLTSRIESVLIAGAGPVGLGAIAMARLLLGTATGVVVADTVPYRLALAARLGAEAIDARDGGFPRGFDVAIDTSGRETARRALLDALATGGVLVCVGHGEDLTLDVSADLIASERAVLGSEYFPYGDLPRNLELLRDHRDFLAGLITHRFPVEELPAAYALFASGECGKVVVVQ